LCCELAASKLRNFWRSMSCTLAMVEVCSLTTLLAKASQVARRSTMAGPPPAAPGQNPNRLDACLATPVKEVPPFIPRLLNDCGSALIWWKAEHIGGGNAHVACVLSSNYNKLPKPISTRGNESTHLPRTEASCILLTSLPD